MSSGGTAHVAVGFNTETAFLQLPRADYINYSTHIYLSKVGTITKVSSYTVSSL